MNCTTNKADLTLSDDEIKILDVFKNIPDDKKNEAIINLYVLAENSARDNEL